ncbi:hypothetical protein CsSME_00040366 [Camellia sinensis var. sinensis]
MKCLLGWEIGQERMRTLTSSYYRGGKGIIMVSLSSSPIFSFCNSQPSELLKLRWNHLARSYAYGLSKCATVYVCHFRSDLHMILAHLRVLIFELTLLGEIKKPPISCIPFLGPTKHVFS